MLAGDYCHAGVFLQAVAVTSAEDEGTVWIEAPAAVVVV